MRHRRPADVVLAMALAATLTACFAETPTPSPLPPAGGVLADRFPRIEFQGGPVLRHPRVLTVTFEGDDPALVARLEEFGRLVTRSSWWRQVVEGYCVTPDDCIGDGFSAAPAHLRDELPGVVSDLDVEEILFRALLRGDLGDVGDDSLLTVYLPAGVRLRDATYPAYCDGGPRGYHSALRPGSDVIAYAVIPRCGDETELTSTASHEILEASTNPDPSAHGFALHPSGFAAGFSASGVEPVDPCGLITMDGHQTTEQGFAFHRAWSNRAAGQGLDPCVPTTASGAYRALVPREPTVILSSGETTARIELDAISRPGERWSVSAPEISAEREPCLTLALDSSQVESGDTVTLTISVTVQTERDLCFIALVSTDGGVSSLWPLPVRLAP